MTLRPISVASECVPFAKTGGLADVVGALATAPGAHDVEVRVLLPPYRSIAHLADGAEVVLDAGSKFGGPVRVLVKQEAGRRPSSDRCAASL